METDTVFFITGGAGGIGTATAQLVTSRGHRAVVCDIDYAAAERRCKLLGDRAYPMALDVRDPREWERALDETWLRFGRLDVLVNNAGLIYTGHASMISDDEIDHMLGVNFLGLVYGCRAAVPRMMRYGGGHIINIGSLASYATLPGQTVYCATKHAVRAFTHGYAMELRNSPITFTLVCPAAVNTPMWQKQLTDDAAALSFADKVLDPRQVARAVYKAAKHRPREIMIPALKGSSLKIVGGFPGFMAQVLAKVEKKGRRTMERLRREKSRTVSTAHAFTDLPCAEIGKSPN